MFIPVTVLTTDIWFGFPTASSDTTTTMTTSSNMETTGTTATTATPAPILGYDVTLL